LISGAPHGGVVPGWVEAGIHGVQRPREWDAVAIANGVAVQGNEAAFVCLADGTLLVEEGEGDFTALADALEGDIVAPYRAIAIRRSAERWAVAARGITLVALPGRTGEEIQLTVHGMERTLVVDGTPTLERIPELEALGQGSFALEAVRLEDALWEVRVAPL
jgi:hypothetical protein